MLGTLVIGFDSLARQFSKEFLKIVCKICERSERYGTRSLDVMIEHGSMPPTPPSGVIGTEKRDLDPICHSCHNITWSGSRSCVDIFDRWTSCRAVVFLTKRRRTEVRTGTQRLGASCVLSKLPAEPAQGLHYKE